MCNASQSILFPPAERWSLFTGERGFCLINRHALCINCSIGRKILYSFRSHQLPSISCKLCWCLLIVCLVCLANTAVRLVYRPQYSASGEVLGIVVYRPLNSASEVLGMVVYRPLYSASGEVLGMLCWHYIGSWQWRVGDGVLAVEYWRWSSVCRVLAMEWWLWSVDGGEPSVESR